MSRTGQDATIAFVTATALISVVYNYNRPWISWFWVPRYCPSLFNCLMASHKRSTFGFSSDSNTLSSWRLRGIRDMSRDRVVQTLSNTFFHVPSGSVESCAPEKRVGNNTFQDMHGWWVKVVKAWWDWSKLPTHHKNYKRRTIRQIQECSEADSKDKLGSQFQSSLRIPILDRSRKAIMFQYMSLYSLSESSHGSPQRSLGLTLIQSNSLSSTTPPDCANVLRQIQICLPGHWRYGLTVISQSGRPPESWTLKLRERQIVENKRNSWVSRSPRSQYQLSSDKDWKVCRPKAPSFAKTSQGQDLQSLQVVQHKTWRRMLFHAQRNETRRFKSLNTAGILKLAIVS